MSRFSNGIALHDKQGVSAVKWAAVHHAVPHQPARIGGKVDIGAGGAGARATAWRHIQPDGLGLTENAQL